MKLDIPDDILLKSHLNEQEFKIQLALFLYQRNALTLESASHFAEIDSYDFQKKLGENKIPVHYTQRDFEDDLSMLNEP
jgi:predicted HTH domain antitoxin